MHSVGTRGFERLVTLLLGGVSTHLLFLARCVAGMSPRYESSLRAGISHISPQSCGTAESMEWRMSWVSLSISCADLSFAFSAFYVRTVQISYKYVHVPSFPLRQSRRLCSPPGTKPHTKIPYFEASLTRVLILSSMALSSSPVASPLVSVQLDSPLSFRACQRFLFSSQSSIAYLKAPRPFPVQTRSVRIRGAVC